MIAILRPSGDHSGHATIGRHWNVALNSVRSPPSRVAGAVSRKRGRWGRSALATESVSGRRATAPGRVAYSGDLPGSGAVVVIDHGRRTYSVYSKIGRSLVVVGDQVEAGQTVARARRGLLYFSIRRRGAAVDPLAWVASAPRS